MDRQPVLEGERLLLRPLVPDDWQALFAVAADRELWALHPIHDRWQEGVFRAFFADALAQRGALVVVDKARGAIIGSSRFQGYDRADGGRVEIGWSFLARSHWGTGANAEMKRLMITHAHKYVDCVEFQVGSANIISRKAMANIGGRLTDRITIVDTPDKGAIEHVVYEIRREDFAHGPLAG